MLVFWKILRTYQMDDHIRCVHILEAGTLFEKFLNFIKMLENLKYVQNTCILSN